VPLHVASATTLAREAAKAAAPPPQAEGKAKEKTKARMAEERDFAYVGERDACPRGGRVLACAWIAA